MTPLGLYAKVFADPTYSKAIDGEAQVEFAIGALRGLRERGGPIRSVIDLGAGRGRTIAAMLHEFGDSLAIQSFDLKRFHDFSADRVPHVDLDLEDSEDRERLRNVPPVDCVVCLDVLEHLHEQTITRVIYGLALVCRYLVVTVANHPDVWDGTDLHVTQRPQDWWTDKFTDRFDVVSAARNDAGNLFSYVLKSHHEHAV